MADIKALLEERQQVVVRLEELKTTAADRAFTAEEQANWDAANKRYDEIKPLIERHRHVEKLKKEAEESVSNPEIGRGALPNHPAEERTEITDDDRTHAMGAWFANRSGQAITERQLQACQRTGFNPGVGTLDIRLGKAPRNLKEARTSLMSTQIGSAGGFTIPATLMSTLESAMLMFGGLRQAATVIRTATGEPVSQLTVDDTANTGSKSQEGTAATDATDMAFAKRTLGSYDYNTGIINVPFNLTRDSIFDVSSLVFSKLGERLARKTEPLYTNGTGAAEPYGILAGATLGVTAASATAIAFDELIQLRYSVGKAYRVGPGVGFMFSDGIAGAIRLLKDGIGRYIWSTNPLEGEPDRLDGYPVYINMDMASSSTASAKTVLFGMLSKYMIRDVGSIRLAQSDQYAWEKDVISFIGRIATDGMLMDAGQHPVKYLIQHS